MKNHYIPRLLLKQFAEKEKVNLYDFGTKTFGTKKVRDVFVMSDIFDTELEQDFATKLEGPFGNLLHHKLLAGDTITIDRKENLLMRKFLMIQLLRAPIVNTTWDEMVERTGLKDHPSVQAKEFLERHHPEFKLLFEKARPSNETYISDLKKAMAIMSLEELAVSVNPYHMSLSLWFAVRRAMASTIAFWDCTDIGQEFILPKLPGISEMDHVSIFHKGIILRKLLDEHKGISKIREREINSLLFGTSMFSENFMIFPLSATRAMICFSPYFKAFFPTLDATGTFEMAVPLLPKEQFEKHFYRPMRMELFTRCNSINNQYYKYNVKQLEAEEVMQLNALMLDMETEEFVFHDFNRIRDSFWYYDHKAQFICEKKHDFHQWG